MGKVFGLSLMKFTLTFDGELPSNGKPKKKWNIRKALHPQLAELWRIDPALQRVARDSHIPAKRGVIQSGQHHTLDTGDPPFQLFPADMPLINLLEPIEIGGRAFLPLVRNSYALTCGLKILFLRKEPPGKVYQGGDMDNRIKTLLDALSVPPHPEHVIQDDSFQGSIFCLMEDDGLMTRLDVETHRLLSAPDSSAHEVRLIIEVDVRVTQPRWYNQPYLGG